MTYDLNSGDFIDLVRPDAPGARPDAAVTAVDDCPDRLQVRFEPAGTDVMGMTEGPAHNRGLPADFTMFCHDESRSERKDGHYFAPKNVPV